MTNYNDIIVGMSPSVKRLIKRIASLPEEDQLEIAELVDDIEHQTGFYRLTATERDALREGLDAASLRLFTHEQEMEEFHRLNRSA